MRIGGDELFRVAICDDEPQEAAYIAGLMRDILSERGAEFTVDTFVSPTTLERAWNAGGKRYDLLLPDILMEVKNGVEWRGFCGKRKNRHR